MTIIVQTLNPPSVQLPPPKDIPTLPLSIVEESLCYLRLVYNPPVRGTRIIERRKVFPAIDSSQSTAIPLDEVDEMALDSIRRDKFERSHSMRWLTALFSKLQSQNMDSVSDRDSLLRDTLINDAASLLAICAGTASAGTLSRIFSFARGSVNVPIVDMPLENSDYSTLGMQTWGSASVLADIIIDDPREFKIADGGSLRILELGAGTGLVSIALARYLSLRDICAFISPTDFNHTVMSNMKNNIEANCGLLSPSITLTASFLDWSQPETCDPTFPGTFDLILGADIAYELDHAVWLRSCVAKLLRRSHASESQSSQFHLIVPLRPTHTFESGAIEVAFPFAQGQKTQELVIIKKDIIVCEADIGGKDGEIEYAYYVIGWHGRDPDHRTDSKDK